MLMINLFILVTTFFSNKCYYSLVILLTMKKYIIFSQESRMSYLIYIQFNLKYLKCLPRVVDNLASLFARSLCAAVFRVMTFFQFND